MAEEQNTDNNAEQNDEQEGKGGKKKKLILFGVIGLVLVATVVLALWLFGGSSSS